MLRDGEASVFLGTEFNERGSQLSPDGRWVAYVSDESGGEQIYVQPFPQGGEVIPISVDGGVEPVWSRDGTELFFRAGNRMMVVDVELGARFRAGRPKVLFEGGYDLDPFRTGRANYDVSADGQFLMVRRREMVSTARLTIVLNWFQELTERVPVP